MNDCTVCGHHATSHNTGTCNISAISTINGTTSYADRPGGVCGCTAMPFDMVCPTCAKPFVCAQAHEQHDCLACYEAKRHDADAESFGPLIDALNAHGIVCSANDIWNTGGHVMCLGVHLDDNPHGPYVMWSDDAEMMGFGFYPDDDQTADCSLDPAAGWGWGVGDLQRPEDSYSWAWQDNAERAAAFAASVIPALREWIAAQTFTTRTDTFMGKDYDVRLVVDPTPVVIPEVEVTTYA